MYRWGDQFEKHRRAVAGLDIEAAVVGLLHRANRPWCNVLLFVINL